MKDRLLLTHRDGGDMPDPVGAVEKDMQHMHMRGAATLRHMHMRGAAPLRFDRYSCEEGRRPETPNTVHVH
jgi:hypothetical protein